MPRVGTSSEVGGPQPGEYYIPALDASAEAKSILDERDGLGQRALLVTAAPHESNESAVLAMMWKRFQDGKGLSFL